KDLKEGVTQAKGTHDDQTRVDSEVANAVAMTADDDDVEDDNEKDDAGGQDLSLDTYPEAVAQLRLQELALIARVGK
ncbi:hypothetical protein BGZ65_010107, partial [Modicella reniformis]